MSSEPKTSASLKALSVVLSVLAGFLVVEALTRIMLPSLTWKTYKNLDLGWASREYLAFRPEQDPVIAAQKRILYLGDSYLAGGGVTNLADRFPLVLQKRLGDGFLSQILATAGWGTDQELLAFLQKGAIWKPDLVIVAFTAHNDLRNNASNESAKNKNAKPYFVVEPENGGLALFDYRGQPMNWPKVVLRSKVHMRSHVWDLLVRRLIGKEDDDRAEPASDTKVDLRYRLVHDWKEFQKEVTELAPILSGSPQQRLSNISAYIQGDLEPTNFAWELLEGILQRLHDEVERAGAKLLVVMLPDTIKPQDTRFITGSAFRHEYQTPDGSFIFDMSEPRRRMVDITDRLEIELFDPTEQFIHTIESENLVEASWPLPTDNHFSAVGHEIIASQLFAYLDRKGHLAH